MIVEYRIAVATAMLLSAAYFDLRSREIDDRLWISFSSVGVLLYVYEFVITGTVSDLVSILLIIGGTAGVVLLLCRLGFYAGADALALLSLSVVLPLYNPQIYALSAYHNPLYLLFNPVTFVMVLANATIWVLILPLYFMLRNLSRLLRGEHIFSGFEDESWWRKVVVVFLGYRMKYASADNFYLTLETRVAGKRKFVFRMLNEDEDFLQGQDVWGTPGIPFLLFMTIGFFTMLLLGDLVTLLMDSLFSILIP
jgi:preflagellin peptidase FlaK